jgi:tRNA-specific 2-thiouridylase
MRLWSEEGGNGGTGDPQRPSGAADDARRVCDALGIPLKIVDYRAPFREQVVDYFLAEYSQGRTPNPCLACNRYIKFGLLLDEAVAHEADFLATGHYARVRRSNGSHQLLRGLDRSKDQSYFLYMLGQRHLRRLLLPLGDYSKRQVRAMARERGLPTGRATESQDLCFVPEGDYRRVLGRLIPESVLPGPIVDSSGKVLGQHRGLPFYTVGQRKGLGVSAPEALYVIALDVSHNALVVGPSSELGRSTLVAKDVTFVSGRLPAATLRAEAKIRYRARLRRATVEPLGGQKARVSFEQPLRDITPGQAVVFYDGDVVLGGGIICDQPADR